ncbi:MAG: CDP-glycerol glycerophosphotransferase family protein [Chloroflexi bacterium]|nr:CDP-glycerol glycerophosphotransferase family protein [Chloroflexota bacterium]
MGWGEYLLATALLRPLGRIFSFYPMRRRRVVLATARAPVLEGNLASVHCAMRERHPDLEYILLLEPYGYGVRGKLAYLARLVRGMYYLQTSGLFVLDNAYFPVHVVQHRPETTVVQVWHAAGALKRFGLDAPAVAASAELRFLHRNYDCVIVGGNAARRPYASGLRTPLDRVLALGSPRTDFFFAPGAMEAAREKLLARHPQLRGRRVVLYAPTFRGRGEAKRAAPGFNAVRLRSLLPDDHALVLKAHPNLDPGATPTGGYDVVFDPAGEINEIFTVADVLVTDYSSSIFEWALLRRPLILLVPDLERYETDPGLYLDYRTEMIGTQVTDTDGVAAALADGAFDGSGYAEFIKRHLGACDGMASVRFVERFLESDTLPAHDSHE